MAETAPLPFAVDTDIAPLQRQYFESVAQNVSDPRLKSQLYDKVRATFGGIQQARDIQRNKAQEEEDRSLSLEMRRAQLDQNRLELGNARDKVRKQQELASRGLAFNTAMSDAEPALRGMDPEKARAKLYEIGSQFSDVVAEVPAAQSRLSLIDKSLTTLKKLDFRNIKTAAQLGDDQIADQLYPGITRDPDYQAEKVLAARKIEAAKARQDYKSSEDINSAAKAFASAISEDLKQSVTSGTVNWDVIDTALQNLDAIGYIIPERKQALLDLGIKALATEKKPVTKKSGATTSEGLAMLKTIAIDAGMQAAIKSRELAEKLKKLPVAPVEAPTDDYNAAVPTTSQ
jgi:hypothetical protein